MSLDENKRLISEADSAHGRNAAVKELRGVYRRSVTWAASLSSVAIVSGTYLLLLLTDKAPRIITPLPAAAQNAQNILAEPSLEGTVKIAAGAIAIIGGCAAGAFAREAYQTNQYLKKTIAEIAQNLIYPEFRL